MKQIFLSLFLIIGLKSFAQVSYILDASNALPENTGQALVQDSLGFIWIGTQNGLLRYDGQHFDLFKASSHGLLNNQIEALKVLPDGRILIASRNGLNLFDPWEETMLSFQPDKHENFEANWFVSITFRNDSIFASSFYGLHILNLDLQRLSFIPNDNQQERTSTRLIKLGEEQPKIYFAQENMLFEYRKGYLQLVHRFSDRIFAIIEKEDEWLVATADGLKIYKPNQAQDYNFPMPAPGMDFILDLGESSDGRLWCLSTSGTYVWNSAKWEHYHSAAVGEKQLSHSLSLDFLEDHHGQIWIGTGQGINIIDPRRNHVKRLSIDFKGPEFAYTQNVEVLFADDDSDELWIGCSDKLHRVKIDSSGQWKPLKPGAPFNKATVNVDYICKGWNEDLLLGTSDGEFFRRNPAGNWESLLNKKGLRQLRGIEKAARPNSYWLGFGDGLRRWDAQKGLYLPDGIPNIPVVQMDFVGNELWVSSAKGLYRIDTASTAWTLSVSGELFPNTLISDFVEIDEVLWMSSFGAGLYRFEPKTNQLKIYNEESGLSNNNVWAIYPDKEGYLWLSTDMGISRFNPRNETFTSFYAKSDGLNFNDFSLLAHAQLKSGELLFGNPKGISAFLPSELQIDSFNISPQVHTLSLDYKSAPKLLKSAIKEQRIVLEPGWTNLGLSFSAFNYRPSALSWEFRLKPGNWISMKDASLNLGRPEPGTYLLEVRNRNHQNQGAAQALQLELVVLPAYYESAWFKLGLVVLILLLSGFSVYIYNRRKIRKLELQQKVHRERERISRDLHDHVGAHLSRIASDLDILELELKQKGSEEGLDHIQDTRNFTTETIRLLRDTIWAIDKDDYSLKEFAAKIEAFLEQYLADYLDWNLETDFKRNHTLQSREVLNLLRILQEATQNMLKYARAQHFTVKLSGPNPIILEIEDDGIGMDENKVKPDSYGLKNIRDRAEEIGAKVHISGSKGVSIKVEL